MATIELRDPAEARRYLLQGLWLRRATAPDAAGVRLALEWCLELLANGHPLPPAGFVADAGHLVYGAPPDGRPANPRPVPGWTATQLRLYEDHVLGKLYADISFERGADALRQLQGRDRTRGLAYLLERFRDRAGFGGVLLSPALVKSLLELPGDVVLQEGFASLSADGPSAAVVEQFDDLIRRTRTAAEVLGPEDLFELETGTALADLAQSVALRQIVRMAGQLLGAVPPARPRPRPGRREVPTRVRDEDLYPVGGFSSLANRGSVESLLHSQLAFMERDERPDLFDIKFLRDELLYYARDENAFLRRRRAMLFVLEPDLATARFKDAELPCQRIVLALAFLVAVVKRMSEWLSSEALQFDVIFAGSADALAAERGQLELLLRETIQAGTVRLLTMPKPAQLHQHITDSARQSGCQLLQLCTKATALPDDNEWVGGQLVIAGPRPQLHWDMTIELADADDALGAWAHALASFLQAVV